MMSNNEPPKYSSHFRVYLEFHHIESRNTINIYIYIYI